MPLFVILVLGPALAFNLHILLHFWREGHPVAGHSRPSQRTVLFVTATARRGKEDAPSQLGVEERAGQRGNGAVVMFAPRSRRPIRRDVA